MCHVVKQVLKYSAISKRNDFDKSELQHRGHPQTSLTNIAQISPQGQFRMKAICSNPTTNTTWPQCKGTTWSRNLSKQLRSRHRNGTVMVSMQTGETKRIAGGCTGCECESSIRRQATSATFGEGRKLFM